MSEVTVVRNDCTDGGGASKRSRGFTLIELLVVLIIIGMLVAVAWPAYRSQVQRAHRAQAAASLLQAQQFMERFCSVQGSYLMPDGSPPALPSDLQAVRSDERVLYRLRIERADGSAYQLRAEPEGPMLGDVCGALSLDHAHMRGRSGTGPSVHECWR